MLLLLGLLIVAATGAFAGLLIAYNLTGPDYTVVMFGNTLGTLTSMQIFLAGIALTLVFCVGLLAVVLGAVSARRRRVVRLAERREARAVLAQRDAQAADAGSATREAQPDVATPEPSGPRHSHRWHVFGH